MSAPVYFLNAAPARACAQPSYVMLVPGCHNAMQLCTQNNNSNAHITLVAQPNYTNTVCNRRPAPSMTFTIPAYHAVSSGMLANRPDDVIGQISKQILNLNEKDMEKYLDDEGFTKHLFACYKIVFDIGWKQEFWTRQKNSYTRFECSNWPEFCLYNLDRLEAFIHTMKNEFKKYIDYVRNYEQKLPSELEISSDSYVQLRRAATNDNLKRFKNVVRNIFDECKEHAQQACITSTSKIYRHENLHDLGEDDFMQYKIQMFEDLQESLLSYIDQTIYITKYTLASGRWCLSKTLEDC